jgi:hypothetical protein
MGDAETDEEVDEEVRDAADTAREARGAVSLARSCVVSIGPAATTSLIRRTATGLGARLAVMPPGAHVC